jgi:hypothetical protein
MQFILSNKIKMFMCLGCMVIYALVFRGFIKYPLMILISDLPPLLRTFSILFVGSPIWVLGACAGSYYLKLQRANP